MKKPGKLASVLAPVMIALIIVVLNIGAFKVMNTMMAGEVKSVMGGALVTDSFEDLEGLEKVQTQPNDSHVERFMRPSAAVPMEKKYPFSKEGQNIPKTFTIPAEVVRAYFDIISDASNMGTKKGGCGSIGFQQLPYPFAYGLFSEDLKKAVAYDGFLKSFEGIGHINLLKLVEAPPVKLNDQIFPGYFVEIEVIEGSNTDMKTYFAYYYGYVTVKQEGEKGFKINSIELMPEDFLCHAYHGWWHDAESLVRILYGEKQGIIDKILQVEEDGDFRNVMAKGKDGRQYRFLFIRITNGADISLRQYVMEEGRWKEIKIKLEEK